MRVVADNRIDNGSERQSNVSVEIRANSVSNRVPNRSNNESRNKRLNYITNAINKCKEYIFDLFISFIHPFIKSIFCEPLLQINEFERRI